MKLFFAKLAFLIVSSFVLANLIALAYATIAPSKVEFPGTEIYDAIRKADQPSPCHKLVVGDSVCHQLLLGQTLDDTLNLSSNWGINVCGQYMLARLALKHSSGIKEIILAYQPFVFTTSQHGKLTFPYFVKPLYTQAEFRDQMTPELREELDRRPLYRLVLLPMFRYTGMLDSIDYSNTDTVHSYKYFCPLAVQYLRKFSDLCHERGIRFRVVSTPISSGAGFDQKIFLKEIAEAHLEDIFTGYMETIRYVDPNELADGTHFKTPYIESVSAQFVKILN